MSALDQSPSSDRRIAVLGAGPMGLAVAYQLARDGYEPVVFEADDRVGGMAAHFDFSGTSIERYYHFHCISDRAYLEVLKELGLSDRLHWVKSKMGYWYLDQLQAWGNPIALLNFIGLSWISKFRYALHVFLSTKRKDWKPLDREDAVRWVKRWVGPEAYEVLWQKLFEYKFYEYTPNLSAAWIWSRVRRIGRSRYNLMHEKLGYLDGGSHTLLTAMQTDIESHGGKIVLSAPIEKVIIDDGQVRGVQVGGQVHSFAKVISTIPLPYIARVMPDLPADILEKFTSKKNIAVVCVIVKLRRPFSNYFWVNTNDPDMDIPGFIEYSNLNPMGPPNSGQPAILYVPFYIPGEHPKYAEPDAVFLEKVRSYLKKIDPSLKDDDFLDIRASRYRFAQPICEPGYLDTLPPVALPITGLWVADTSYYYPEDRGISESIDLGRKIAKDAEAFKI
jgi:protoporphyrinogen oxidase